MGSQIADLPAPWPGEPESMLVTLDTGERIHYLDWRAALAAAGPDDVAATSRDTPGPPLLLVHGLLQAGWSWAPVARRLAPLLPTIALDLRGHGLSDSPRSGYDLDSLAFDALTVLSANGWGSDARGPAVVVAGHGLGAMVGVAMASLRPGSVAGLGLIDGGWEEMAEATGMDAAEYGRTIGDPPEVLASMAAYLADRRDYDPPSWDADQERAARAAVDEKHAGHVAPVVRAHVLRGAVEAMWSFEPEDAAALDLPLLVAVESGSADDELARERRLALEDLLAMRRRRGMPDAHVLRLTSAGHNLMRYRPADVALALLELARRTTSTSARTPGAPG